MKIITEQQAKVLRFLKSHLAEKGYPPSIREIGKYMGLSTTRAVTGHLTALERKGYIERGTGARCIRILQREEAKDGG